MKTNEKTLQDRLYFLLIFLLSVGVFYLDVLLPLGVATGILFVPVIMLCLKLSDKRNIFIVTSLVSGLVIFEVFYSNDGSLWKGLINKFLIILLLWIVCFYTYKWSQFLEKSNAVMEDLKAKSSDLERSRKSMLSMMEDAQMAKDKAMKAENEIRLLNQSLEKIVKLRTEELQEKITELKQQKQDLERVNLELDRFVYTASHDLKTPLRGISAYATFLDMDYSDKIDETGRKYLKDIRKGANRLDQLIRDLLTLSRLSRVKNPYKQIDSKKLVADVMDRLEYDLSEHHIQMNVSDVLPSMMCDPIKIAEVFLNLINNAIKFSVNENSLNPAVINVTYQESPEDHIFCVQDNGIGIEEKYFDQVFEIFKRLHKESEYSGTGAGLSIVKRIVEDHHGKVWVESEFGQGSSFYFSIPKLLMNENNA